MKRQWISRLLWIILILFMGLNLFFPIAAHLTGDPFPALLGFRQALVLTGSMEPAVHVGDWLLFRSQTSYEPGQIVLYQESSRLVTHRVIDVLDHQLVTQGDANNTPDQPVSRDRVLCRMVLRVPQLGTLAWFLKTPAGLVILSTLILLIFSGERALASLSRRQARD